MGTAGLKDVPSITLGCSRYQDRASHKVANTLLYFNNKSCHEVLGMASVLVMFSSIQSLQFLIFNTL
jgi:hypothetical protein